MYSLHFLVTHSVATRCALPVPAPQFAQWALDPSFRLFDYGSKAANRRHYGTDRPPSLAGQREVSICQTKP